MRPEYEAWITANVEGDVIENPILLATHLG
jgi:hypothetical protein